MRKRKTPSTDVVVVGAPPAPLRDYYHRFLRLSWPAALGVIVVVFLALNALYACAYLVVGGLENAREGSFADAFFFSVQTMGTIGYGSMFPRTPLANALVVSEAVVGLLVTAVTTGLVFSKFSQPSSHIAFTSRVTIAPMDGVPTLSFRLGNQRGNQVVEAELRVTFVRTERTKEGGVFYRMYDLPLVRHRSPAFSRSWTAMHTITEGSMLWSYTPEKMKRDEVELIVSVIGIDDTSLQPVHARTRYIDDQIVWGARHADTLSEREDGVLVLDLSRFDDVVPAEPTEGFPYRYTPPG